MDPNGEFSKIDAMLPKKKGIATESHARLIESCLDWLRNSDVAISQDTLPSFSNFGSVPVTHRTPEERSEDLEKVANWLRRKGKKDHKYDLSGEFRKLDKLLPQKAGQNVAERARDIEGALDWLRNSGVPSVDDDLAKALGRVGSVPISLRTPEQRMKDQQDALNWLRHKGKNDNVVDPTGEFRKIDSLLPKKKSQSKADRAKEMEQAIDWCRNHVIDLEDLIAGTFEPVPSINATTRSAEQRSKDLQDALNWLRHQGQNDNAFDPTGEFRKLDKFLPKKRGQRPEDSLFEDPCQSHGKAKPRTAS
jgi:hypothetical protein